MTRFQFDIHATDGAARTGTISMRRGEIRTPAFMPVGTAATVKAMKPEVEVYGVEPEAGNDGQMSFRSGTIVRIDPPKTIAGGAKTTALGKLNFEIIRDLVSDIATVNDEDLLEIQRFAVYRTKLLIEPTGALGLAALLTRAVNARGPVAVVVSGGNADLRLLGGTMNDER